MRDWTLFLLALEICLLSTTEEDAKFVAQRRMKSVGAFYSRAPGVVYSRLGCSLLYDWEVFERCFSCAKCRVQEATHYCHNFCPPLSLKTSSESQKYDTEKLRDNLFTTATHIANDGFTATSAA